MKKYLIVIESTENGYSAYSPDIQGCVAFGHTKEETEKNILEAIRNHLESLKEEGYKTPEPKCYAKYFEIVD
ncbi:MAG: type II toxin-antitoxin system HicB family antitoxin [Bacteroidota bacterium]|nr:type II toxin-antitoxin system HicB family antitoxin [Bacteroidota bacterium]MDP4189968.1 type II toxin-antitoxin system HicB family antitoxin [Bacteroidota bacterium]MDP4193400.1 type II toxin-antitoxin system HicB family antitoxin [Bacteroidota bacterium]